MIPTQVLPPTTREVSTTPRRDERSSTTPDGVFDRILDAARERSNHTPDRPDARAPEARPRPPATGAARHEAARPDDVASEADPETDVVADQAPPTDTAGETTPTATAVDTTGNAAASYGSTEGSDSSVESVTPALVPAAAPTTELPTAVDAGPTSPDGPGTPAVETTSIAPSAATTPIGDENTTPEPTTTGPEVARTDTAPEAASPSEPDPIGTTATGAAPTGTDTATLRSTDAAPSDTIGRVAATGAPSATATTGPQTTDPTPTSATVDAPTGTRPSGDDAGDTDGSTTDDGAMPETTTEPQGPTRSDRADAVADDTSTDTGTEAVDAEPAGPSTTRNPTGIEATTAGDTRPIERGAAPTPTTRPATATPLTETLTEPLADLIRPAMAALRTGPDGVRDLRLELRTADGTSLGVELRADGDEIRVVLSGEAGDTLARLGAERDRLAAELRRSGLQLGGLDVTTDDRHDRPAAEAGTTASGGVDGEAGRDDAYRAVSLPTTTSRRAGGLDVDL